MVKLFHWRRWQWFMQRLFRKRQSSDFYSRNSLRKYSRRHWRSLSSSSSTKDCEISVEGVFWERKMLFIMGIFLSFCPFFNGSTVEHFSIILQCFQIDIDISSTVMVILAWLWSKKVAHALPDSLAHDEAPLPRCMKNCLRWWSD
jgi:hypothetical protein